MLNIITALYQEAIPIIKKYNLKCTNNIYQNNYINLIITGVGKIKSAINTALLLSKYPCKSLNIGIAGSNKYQKNEGFFIHKIIDYDSKKEYYPDYFEKSATLTTISKVGLYFELVDMEGSGFFEACYKFLSVEKIILYKIVSDTLYEKVEKEEIPTLINSHLKIIEKILDTKEDNEIEKFLKNINFPFTHSQKTIFKNLITYYYLKNKTFPTIPDLKNKKEIQKFLKELHDSLC